MNRFVLAALCLPLFGCQSLVHPRIAEGMPAPTWVEVQHRTPQVVESDDSSYEEEQGPREIGARHILIMFKGSSRAPATVGRSRQAAYERAREVLNKLHNGASFESLVAEYSDEPGAAERKGDLGTFRRSAMVKAFSDAAFALKPGEISGIVESPFGFHVIQRTK